ncbi:MAG: UDP-N-acetylmuramoyl-L-alanine--D-glutamate ligase [bacterium]|nr:UDP-N-acetylmuramoyl-L-alanine--D-glutamate ligase [bacterium]
MSGAFANLRVVVMGLGRFGGGVGVSKWLAGQGARVVVSDRAEASTLAESIAKVSGLGIEIHCGGHDPNDLAGADLLVVSPAVDKTRSEFVAAARDGNIPITSEMNLFVERCPGRIVGVTGTTGKSTTCAMLHAVLQAAAKRGEVKARRVYFGGNIGSSLLGDLDSISPDDLVVLELSSYQLEDLAALRQSPPVAAITNLSPRHLDRHGSYEAYVNAKLNICRHQHSGEAVVLGSTDAMLLAAVADITDRTGARLLTCEPWAGEGPALKVLGQHNRRNAALATRVAERLGVSRVFAAAALAEFEGLPHRLQFVGQVDGVDFINDSKATSPEAVAAALDASDRSVILIVGGKSQEASWEPVLARRSDSIAAAICMGESGPGLAKLLSGTVVATLKDAVAEARRQARPGDTVLLSPGCPSFDQYANYEARGQAFIGLIGGR